MIKNLCTLICGKYINLYPFKYQVIKVINLEMGDENMTRKILKVLLLVISISYGLWLVYNQLFPGINSIHGQSIYIEDASKLESLAEDIVKVKPIGKKKQMLHFSGNTFTWGYTITEVEVLKAYKAANLKERTSLVL